MVEFPDTTAPGPIRQVVEPFHINFVNRFPLIGTLIFTLCLAPLFDLQAPSIYLESVQLLLMVLLTTFFRKHIDRKLFYGWCTFMFLFLLLLFSRIVGMSLNFQRWANFIVDLVSVFLGIYFLARYAKNTARSIRFAVGFYILFNALACCVKFIWQGHFFPDLRLYRRLLVRANHQSGRLCANFAQKHFCYRFKPVVPRKNIRGNSTMLPFPNQSGDSPCS